MATKLFVTTSNPITHIFHFADIHIRNGDIDRSRYEEYRYVFAETNRMMDIHDSIKNQSALIVVAGDVFHHKGKIDTPALKLYFEWIDQLLSRAPVIIICGNHDFRQEDPKHPDMLETVILPYTQRRKTKHRLHYLKNTGCYVYDNIGFGVVSVKDTLRYGNTYGIVDNLPKYPYTWTDDQEDIVKYALFHGTVVQSSLPNNKRVTEMKGYPLDWFSNYEFIMLGDNHKQ